MRTSTITTRSPSAVLAQGYIDLGLCKGTLDEVLESGSYKQFYMHRAGHWLGMDVHDAGLYLLKGASQKLVPGMVLTVEPGTYIRPADNVPEEFWDIGVRIEDDVLVTATGIDNLTRRRRSRLPMSRPRVRDERNGCGTHVEPRRCCMTCRRRRRSGRLDARAARSPTAISTSSSSTRAAPARRGAAIARSRCRTARG